MITLAPLSPSEAHEDQLKIKRESGQRSGDRNSKERVEIIAYCSSHVSFQQKTEEEIPNSFHNERVKIQGQILFKRRGMMHSDVLNNIRDHRDSWRVTEERVVGGRSRNLQPDGFSRLNLQVSVDRFVQKLNAVASDHITEAPDIVDWFHVLFLDNF